MHDFLPDFLKGTSGRERDRTDDGIGGGLCEKRMGRFLRNPHDGNQISRGESKKMPWYLNQEGKAAISRVGRSWG